MRNHEQTNGSKHLESLPLSPCSQLPQRQDTSLIGREQELTAIEQAFRDPACRLLTLVGLGGIGKTHLASEAGARLAHHFTHASCFVPLVSIASPALIVPTVASALGHYFHGSEPPQTQLLNFLRQRDMLLVLDNFEHLIEGVDLLTEIIHAAPDIRLLVTSRERLNVREEWVLDIAGLDYPPDERVGEIETYSAIQLFLQSARHAKADFRLTAANQVAVIRICHLVEGMPLGIEMAASWLRVLPCSAIVSEIERSFDFLSSNLRNVPEKHRSMRAVFAHSYHMLTTGQQRVFCKLSVFRGGFTREAAAAVAGATLHTLSELVDRSLLRMDAEGRYDIHELLRQYAEERLEQAGETERTRDAHSAYFAAFLQEKWEPLRNHQQLETLSVIESEFENIRTAWQVMTGQRNAAGLSAAIHSLWRFCDLHTHVHEALALLEQAEDALRSVVRNPEQDRALGQVLTCRGYFFQSIARLETGRALVLEGLELLRHSEMPEDLILAYDALGLLHAWLGEFRLAIAYYEDGEQIARKHNLLWMQARALYMMLYPFTHLNELTKARRAGLKCLEIAEFCGDTAMTAGANRFIGGIDAREGKYAAAKHRYERGLESQKRVGQKWLIARGHYELGSVAAHLHEYACAAEHFLHSIKILTDINSYPSAIFEALRYMTPLFILQGKKAWAVRILNVVIQHPASHQWQRDDAQQILSKLPAKETHESSIAPGRDEILSHTIQDLIVELNRIAASDIEAIQVVQLDDPLTARELEILQLMADGMSNKAIAEYLVLAPNTVKWYVSEILSKLHATSRTQAVSRARLLKLLS